MKENVEERGGALEIDFLELALLLLRKWWLIALCTFVAACSMLIFTKEFVTPMYTATVSIYVNNSTENKPVESITTGTISASSQLVNTYLKIVTSDRVLDKVTAELGGDYTADTLRGMLKGSKVEETEIFKLSIVADDPEEAAHVANVVADVVPGEIANIIEGSSARVIDRAKVPTIRSSPSYRKNTLIGAGVGLVMAIAYLTVTFLLDVRIKEPQKLTDMFGVPVLGQIPDFALQDAKHRDYSYSHGYGSNGSSHSQEEKKA